MSDKIFLKLLNHNSEVVAAKTAKTIAEIAKTEFGREKCTNEEFVKSLIELSKSHDLEILTQTSRALGNICYENGNLNNLRVKKIQNKRCENSQSYFLFLQLKEKR